MTEIKFNDFIKIMEKNNFDNFNIVKPLNHKIGGKKYKIAVNCFEKITE